MKEPALQHLPIDDLLPYARNAKRHPPEQVAQIAASIKEFGFNAPVLVDGEQGIIAGHGRVLAARKLGLATVPCIVLTHLSEAQKRAYIIADNRLGDSDLAPWDWEMLQAEIDALKEENYDYTLTGFTDESLAAAMESALAGLQPEAPADAGKDTEPQNDRAEELRVKWGVETGQLWQLGEHRLLCGDSTKAEDMARVMQGEKADLLLTDPPYGMRLDTDFSKMPRGVNKYSRVIGDEKDFDFSIILKIWEAPLMAVWGGGWFYNTLPAGGSWVIWDKQPQHTIAGPQNHFEECWIYPHKKRIIIRRLWTGFTAKEAGQSRIHPTQKPVSVMEDIGRFMGGWGVCAEPFSGSGTTIIAAENLKRRCRAIEISPAYVAVALQRWADHTGKTPVKI